MPIHDWTRVFDGAFHDFHLAWIAELRTTLNSGLLPPDYYAMVEQVARPTVPDVLTLQTTNGFNGEWSGEPISGATAVAIAPPRVRHRESIDQEIYARRQKSVVIHHASDDRIVALIEILGSSRLARCAPPLSRRPGTAGREPRILTSPAQAPLGLRRRTKKKLSVEAATPAPIMTFLIDLRWTSTASRHQRLADMPCSGQPARRHTRRRTSVRRNSGTEPRKPCLSTTQSGALVITAARSSSSRSDSSDLCIASARAPSLRRASATRGLYSATNLGKRSCRIRARVRARSALL